MFSDTDYIPEIFPSDAGGYDLNYNSHPRPERYTGIQGNLRSTLEIPDVFRHIFSKYPTFNQIQTMILDDALYTDEPLIVSAPTGSGKTVVFELAIIRTLMTMEDLHIKDFKIIYLAPIKALCHERLVDWQIKFNHLGVSCIEATGDHAISELTELAKYKIIITTPEKWDTLTRRWKDFQNFVSEIKLFLIDEIHLVNENVRGATLEVILSRMKTMSSTLKSSYKTDSNNINLRFVAVSATLPNIEDVAVWIGGAQAKFHKMPEEMRPIQLEKFVFGYPSNSYSSYFRFDMSLNYKLGQLIQQYSGGKPTLIFCSTRKGVEMAANVLASSNSFITPRNSQSINELIERLNDTKLAKILSKGIAYHHGGLLTNDRVLIEESFRNCNIPLLLCTSTLATGVNLPAHLVILKSTQVYSQAGTDEYPESLIYQMIGRAGRSQYDNSGVAIIMTQSNKVKLYENMVSGVRPIESNLHKHLPEHLNAEIVLRTITDLGVAVQWIKSTFLYVRAIKNPLHYGFAKGLNKEKVEQKLEELCLITINSLEKHMLLTKDQLYGLTITSTVAGKLMARCYLNFNTMKIFQQMTGHDSLANLMLLISSCHEFNEYKLRMSDKRFLNELNTSKTTALRFPVKGKVKTVSDKIFILLQAVLGNINCTDPSLYQETTKIIPIAEKISKAMVQYISQSEHNVTSKHFKTVYSALILSKSCAAKMWENSPFISKQLNKIGNTYSRLLVEAGKTTFESIYESSARELEAILHRAPPFGNLIQDAISKLPYFNIDLIFINSNFCRVKVRQTNTNCLMGRSYYEKISLIVGDSMNNLLFLKENISFFLLDNKEFDKNIKIIDTNVEVITAHVIHSNLVGLDKSTQIRLKPLPTESQEAFKTKPAVKKNKNTKETSNVPITAANQSNKLNASSTNKSLTNFDSIHDNEYNEFHDNQNVDKDHNDNYVDIEISPPQQMIFNKCRDQGIDHDRNTNLHQLNAVNSNTTLGIDANRSSSNKKFIKKNKISKYDFTTTIVPSQSQENLSQNETEIENDDYTYTKLSKDNENQTYRIVEILEKKLDSGQSNKFKKNCADICSGNINNVLHETSHNNHVNEQCYINDENRFKIDDYVDNEVTKQNINQENDLNAINVKVAVTPECEKDLGICNNSFNTDQTHNSQIETYDYASTMVRAVFPSFPNGYRRQLSAHQPMNKINLLKSICDTGAFSEATDVINNKRLLNVSVIEEDNYQNNPVNDDKLLSSQRSFMTEHEPLSKWSKFENSVANTSNSQVEKIDLAHLKRSNKMIDDLGEGPGSKFKEKLGSFGYETTKRPKIFKSNFSITNFIDNTEATNLTPKRNEFKHKYFYKPPATNVLCKNTDKQSAHIENDVNFITPPNQKYRPFSTSSPPTPNHQPTPTNLNSSIFCLSPPGLKDVNQSYLDADDDNFNEKFLVSNTFREDDLCEFLPPNANRFQFSQTNPREMKMWEQFFDLD